MVREDFHFCIVHRPGKRHGNADSLSRRPCTQCGREDHEDGSAISISTPTQSPVAVLTERPSQDLRNLQLEDGLLLRAVEKGEKPDIGDVRREGPEAQRLLQLWGRLITDGGLLKQTYMASSPGSKW